MAAYFSTDGRPGVPGQPPFCRNVVISSAFADTYAGKLEPLGRFRLKDVEGEQELYTLPQDSSSR